MESSDLKYYVNLQFDLWENGFAQVICIQYQCQKYIYTFSNIVMHIIFLLFFKALKASCEQNTVIDSMILMK